MNNNPEILVVGSVAFDSVKTPSEEKREVLGGSATYFSFSASCFSRINLVATVGDDFHHKYINLFKRRPINLSGLKKERGLTFRWHGVYKDNFNDRETIKLDLNVFKDFNPEIPENYRNNKYVFLANIDPVLQGKVLSQIKNPKLVVCDTIDHWIRSKKKHIIDLLFVSDILIVNDAEIKLLSNESNIIKAAKKVLNIGKLSAIVIKKGEHGALCIGKSSNNNKTNWFFYVPAYPVKEVFDPTGAGDSFAGGFMGFLSNCRKINKNSIKKAVVYGSVMASFCVEDFSVNRLVKLTRKDIEKRYNEFKKFTQF